MSIGYTKVELISEEAFRRKMEGETNREIGERYGLTREQVHNLVSRQNRKQRLMAAGYVPPSEEPSAQRACKRRYMARLKVFRI